MNYISDSHLLRTEHYIFRVLVMVINTIMLVVISIFKTSVWENVWFYFKGLLRHILHFNQVAIDPFLLKINTLNYLSASGVYHFDVTFCRDWLSWSLSLFIESISFSLLSLFTQYFLISYNFLNHLFRSQFFDPILFKHIENWIEFIIAPVLWKFVICDFSKGPYGTIRSH